MNPRDMKKGLNALINNAFACKVYAQEVLKFLYDSNYNKCLDLDLSTLIMITADKFKLDINAILPKDEEVSE